MGENMRGFRRYSMRVSGGCIGAIGMAGFLAFWLSGCCFFLGF
jgi:hypothetical protein